MSRLKAPTHDRVNDQASNPTTSAAAITLPVRAADLADALGATLVGNPDVVLDRPGAIDSGKTSTITFIRSSNYAKRWADSECGAALVSADIEIENTDDSRAILIVDNADVAFIRVLQAADPGRARPEPGIHPSAVIHPDAVVARSAAIGPNCVVGPGAKVAEHCVLMPNCVLGADVTLGARTILEPGVVIEDRCVIGARCLVASNSVIGADGFGFVPPEGDRPAIKVPQIGNVIIGDDVELGACVTVDRAKLGATTVGDRVKIDNQVHVGHNSVIGDDAIICGRSTLGGSVTVGAGALIGGAVVLNDHSVIGPNAKIAGGTIVLERVPENETYAGIPALPARQALANHGALREIGSFVRSTEKRLKKLEKDRES